MTNISLKYCLGLGSPCDGFDSIYKCCQHASLFGMMRFYHVKLLMFRIIFQATCIVYIFLSLMNQKLVKDVWSNGCTITKILIILKQMGRISRKEWLKRTRPSIKLFMVMGNVVCASHRGRDIVRVSPDEVAGRVVVADHDDTPRPRGQPHPQPPRGRPHHLAEVRYIYQAQDIL